VGVAVIVIKENKVLLGKRRASHGDGCWQFPGGHLEFNESVADCARREVWEETGLQIGEVRPGPFTNDIFSAEDKHYVTLFVTAVYEGGQPEVREPEKCEGWDWFEWTRLPRPLFLPIENLLKQNFIPAELERNEIDVSSPPFS
jgi:8-oxo-dGTP diphosphatase